MPPMPIMGGLQPPMPPTRPVVEQRSLTSAVVVKNVNPRMRQVGIPSPGVKSVRSLFIGFTWCETEGTRKWWWAS